MFGGWRLGGVWGLAFGGWRLEVGVWGLKLNLPSVHDYNFLDDYGLRRPTPFNKTEHFDRYLE